MTFIKSGQGIHHIQLYHQRPRIFEVAWGTGSPDENWLDHVGSPASRAKAQQEPAQALSQSTAEPLQQRHGVDRMKQHEATIDHSANLVYRAVRSDTEKYLNDLHSPSNKMEVTISVLSSDGISGLHSFSSSQLHDYPSLLASTVVVDRIVAICSNAQWTKQGISTKFI